MPLWHGEEVHLAAGAAVPEDDELGVLSRGVGTGPRQFVRQALVAADGEERLESLGSLLSSTSAPHARP